MPNDSSDKNLSIERIDDRVLRILNLSGTFSIDYITYYEKINKRIRTAKITGKKLDPEELALLSNEGKRIKGKKGRFKIVSKSIKVGNIPYTSGKKSEKSGKPPSGRGGINNKNIFPPKSEIVIASKGKVEKPQDPYSKVFDDINESLDKVYKNLLLQNKEIKKSKDEDRRERENQERSAKESKLETIFKGLIKTAEVILKPFRGLLDQIFDYLFNIVLGGVVLDLIDWFNDPKNQDKINSISRFLSDHGSKLFAAYLLFGNALGRFVTRMTGTLVKQLVRLAATNPIIAAGLTAAGLAALSNQVTGQAEGAKVQTENKARAQTGKGLGIQGTDTMGDRTPSTGNMGPTTPYGLLQAAKNGGIIQDFPKTLNVNQISYEEGGGITEQSGVKITGAGPDTQLIAAQPGEIVIPKRTVAMYGSDHFMNMIKQSGASGVPRFANNIQFAQNGGIVGGGSGINSGMLKLSTTFGGAPGTQQTRGIGINASGGNKNSKFNLSGMLTRGVVKSQSTSPKSSVDNAMQNYTSGNNSSGNWKGVPYSLPKVNQKVEEKIGFGGNLNLNMSGGMGKPSKPTSSNSPTSGVNRPPKIKPRSKTLSRSSVIPRGKKESNVRVPSNNFSPRFQAFVNKNYPSSPQPPVGSNITTITLPPEIIKSSSKPQMPNLNSVVDSPDFSASVNNSNRMMTTATYF